jgi:hypothetical protein
MDFHIEALCVYRKTRPVGISVLPIGVPCFGSRVPCSAEIILLAGKMS